MEGTKETKPVRFPQGLFIWRNRARKEELSDFVRKVRTAKLLSDEKILLLADTGMKYLDFR